MRPILIVDGKWVRCRGLELSWRTETRNQPPSRTYNAPRIVPTRSVALVEVKLPDDTQRIYIARRSDWGTRPSGRLVVYLADLVSW